MASAPVVKTSLIELIALRGIADSGDYQGLLGEFWEIIWYMQVAGELLGLSQAAKRQAYEDRTRKQALAGPHS
jgi:hypothetical protein